MCHDSLDEREEPGELTLVSQNLDMASNSVRRILRPLPLASVFYLFPHRLPGVPKLTELLALRRREFVQLCGVVLSLPVAKPVARGVTEMCFEHL